MFSKKPRRPQPIQIAIATRRCVRTRSRLPIVFYFNTLTAHVRQRNFGRFN